MVGSRPGRRSGRLSWTGAVAAAALLALAGCSGGAEPEAEEAIAPESPVEGVTSLALAPSHVGGTVDYEQAPGVGGPHNPRWQTCDVYDAPVAEEFAVHSLEHGAVWLSYSPDLPAEQVQTLQSLVGSSGYVLLSPYPDQDVPVQASAWGLQLGTDDVEDPRLAEFVQAHVQGEQTLEPGAPCSGGVTATGDEADQLLAEG